MAYMEYRNVLLELFLLAQPKVYIEIGVLRAHTFNLLSPHVTELACAVDVNGCKHVERRPNVEVYPMYSEDFWQLWKSPIDICFIDADHSRDAVIADFQGAARWIRPDTGMIFMHDTYPAGPEWTTPERCNSAWAAVEYIKVNYPEFELVTFPWGGAGLTVARLLTTNKPAWMENKT